MGHGVGQGEHLWSGCGRGRHGEEVHEGKQKEWGGRRTVDDDDDDVSGGDGGDGGVGEVGQQRIGLLVEREQQTGGPPTGALGESARRRRRNDGGWAGGVEVMEPLFVGTKRERCSPLLLGCRVSQQEAQRLQDPCPHRLPLSSHYEMGGSDWPGFSNWWRLPQKWSCHLLEHVRS